MTDGTKGKIVKLPLTPARLMQEIRVRAKNKDNVFFSDHAFERQEERSYIMPITQEDVYRVLQLGEIEGTIKKGKNEGEYKATVCFRPKGSRTIGVATVLKDSEDRIFVTTVMWRDA